MIATRKRRWADARRRWHGFESCRASVALGLLADWDVAAAQFVKVMPLDYKRVLRERRAAEARAAAAG